ncbi:nitrogen assimilation transcription factor nira [Ophiostoma piceae UAMH 11346]|uniref:Nitrogen assimilation transcription factor nira n=1 Tax=Ophiostoma piceae (strain UAMH 11346) TaxID=1262450 RepID=S3BY95_OPHP1|nr:nitrogen assimilation transcription factor nira [Ophiostoma piceae UAMH 11346]
MESTDDELSGPVRSSTAQGKQRAVPDSDAEQSAGTSKHGSGTATGPPSVQVQLSKRRRGVGVVTPNACNECRKKRVKCDGRRPCGRCRLQRDIDCIYELPIRQSKEDLRSEIEELRRRQRNSDVVLSALGRSELWEDVLQRLHNGETVDNISDWIDTGAPTPQLQHTQEPKPTMSNATLPQFQHNIAASYPNLNTGHTIPAYTPFSPGLSALSPGMSGQGGLSNGGGSGDPGSQQSISEQHQPQQQQQQYHHNSLQQMHPHLQPQQIPNLLQQPHLIQQDHSPWGNPYSASQAASTQSDSRHDWSVPTQSRVSSWVENVSTHDVANILGAFSRYKGLGLILTPAQPDLKAPSSTWTEISSDLELVQHLLALYFCWEYPTFASLSKEHFLIDFHESRPRYCSPILVNALLALGCRFSTHPDTRANPLDPYSSGDHFFKECQRLFYLEDNHHCLTTIQALGIMSIREASCGRDSESWYYAGQSIRLAIEMGLHQIRNDDGDEDEIAVKAATFWGAFALDHAWSLATGSLPQCSCFPVLPPKPAIIGDIEASVWIPYTDDGVPLHRSCEQPSNVRSVYKCFCELSELVHQSLYILHSPGRPLTSRDLLHMYTKYLNWYDSIPEVLRLGHNFTPAVLFAHMYYHFAILLLFRPLIKLRIIGSSILPKDVCLQAADAIQKLLRSYSQLYTLQRTPSFVPYFVLTSAIMHLAIGAASSGELPPGADIAGTMMPNPDVELTSGPQVSEDHPMRSGDPNQTSPGHGFAQLNSRVIKLDPSVSESINQGIAHLTEMVPCHHFAEQALNILRYLAKKWNIDVQITPVTKSPSPGTKGSTVQKETPVSRPATASLNFFSPNIQEDDFNCSWGVLDAGVSKGFFVGGSAASASLAKAADNLDNPLFWPFPMQGRPMLPPGQSLKEAGFELIS